MITVFLASLGLLTSSAGAQAPRASTDAAVMSWPLSVRSKLRYFSLMSSFLTVLAPAISPTPMVMAGPPVGLSWVPTKSEWLASLSGRYSSRQVDSQQVRSIAILLSSWAECRLAPADRSRPSARSAFGMSVSTHGEIIGGSISHIAQCMGLSMKSELQYSGAGLCESLGRQGED